MEYSVIEFKDQSSFRSWLEEHGQSVPGIWLKIYKKDSAIETVTYAQALDEALCYGWIDGQKKSLDTVSFLQKFTPRRARSMWSKRNIEHVQRLTDAGLITAAGQFEIDRAKNDGRWEQAYDAPSKMQAPDYFLTELAKHPEAQAFYDTLNKTNKYAFAWRLQTAKTEPTRLRRTETFIQMLKDGKKFH